ncbi:MAG: tetratricopeptide repeat-containing sensor histidine kinase [Flavobacteriaceae bacterium]|nr:tetratricopeptide repeat-containing sensor histidine kinase [Flavobacteriaceae bacterium]
MKQLITLTAILLTFFSSFSQTHEQDSLTIQLAYQKQDSAKVDTSIHLIKSLYTTNDFKTALLHIDQSEKLAATLQYHKGTAEIKYYKALIYTQKDDYYNALDNYNKSYNLFVQLNDSLGIAKVNNSIGLIEIKRGNYRKGLRYSLSAIDIFERKNLKSELSIAFNNLSEAYYNTNQFDKALEYNNKALTVREQIKDTSGIIISTRNIAQLYSIRKEYRKAIEYYEKTLNYLDPKKDREIRGEILPIIGEEYLQFNDYKKATTYLLQALRLNKNLKNKNGILKTYNGLANLNLKLKKIRLAENQLDEAYALTKQVDNDVELLENYRLRIELNTLKRNYKNAFYWQEKYHELKDKIEKSKVVPIIFEEPSEVIDSIIDNELTKQNVDVNGRAETKTLKLYIYILIILLIILSIVLISFLFLKKGRNTSASVLEEKSKTLYIENKSLLEKNKELEESNQVKDRLFSIVSHDLKDSITSVKAFLDLLKEGSISKEEFDNLIPELSENANNAAALLINLLNWSKSQMQNLKPKPEQFNIQEVFKEKMSLIEKKVNEKRIVLLDESTRDFVYADRSMIEIVIQNLLANAVKFSKIGDVITVSNRERNNKILICIEDTGVGISEENQKKLFKSIGLTTRGTNEEKGTGLGLSICKELVELNHGRIWVESEPNLGSKFFVELPKVKPVS